MSGTFKWLALKAGTALGRSVSSLFYQLIYREIYREINRLTLDATKTVSDAYILGFLAAEESAERQKGVFRLFPSNPEKILEFVPLMWNIYFGQPMAEYTIEWDRSDPIRPILRYKILVDPMTFDIGKDVVRDNLPWEKLWNGENAYGSMMAGLLTQCSSYVLALRKSDQRIKLKNTRISLRGDDYFEFECQIIPKDELPYFQLGDLPVSVRPDSSESSPDDDSPMNKLWMKITENIDIDLLDKMLDDPTAFLREVLGRGIEKGLKMPALDFLDHFLNDEEKFIQVFGFLEVHIFNEWGQIPEKFFENETFAKICAHQFRLMRKNAAKFIPLTLIQETLDYSGDVLEGLASEAFISNLQGISPEKAVELFFLGMEKALTDLGIDFSALKPTLYADLQKEPENEPGSDESLDKDYYALRKEKRQTLTAQLIDHALLLSSVILSFPGQLLLVLTHKVLSGSNELIRSFFTTIRDEGKTLFELSEQLKEFSEL